MTFENARKALRSRTDSERVIGLQRFFKTAPGEYAHGDVFIGVTVPEVRSVAREFRDLAFADLNRLIRSRIHEERLLALIILVERFRKGEITARGAIYRFYSANMEFVNNWDLVDTSAPTIVGGYFLERDRKPLHRFALSENLWLRRIAIIATFEFIRRNEFEDTIRISQALLGDKHDLIHKACGWMLREVGKRDVAALEGFLAQHASVMPRTMLRYAIERLSPARRKRWMKVEREGVSG